RRARRLIPPTADPAGGTSIRIAVVSSAPMTRPLETKSKGVDAGRRRLLGGALLAAGGALAGFDPGAATAAFAQGGRGRGAGAAPAAQPGTRLVMLGTQGGPNVTLTRNEAAAAVVVDGRPYLIDCGYGTLRALVESGVGYLQIGQVFLTHLHNDHTSDLPALLSHQWTGSR